MLPEPKTHPHNLEIVSKVVKALFKIMGGSLKGDNVLRQPISGMVVHISAGKVFQNLPDPTETEFTIVMSFSGSTSKSFKFKFSDLPDMPEAPEVSVPVAIVEEVPVLVDPTIPQEEPKRGDT